MLYDLWTHAVFLVEESSLVFLVEESTPSVSCRESVQQLAGLKKKVVE